MLAQGTKQDMDMVGHDDPVAQVVALTVEVGQGVRDDASYPGLAQDTGAVTGIEPVFDASGEALVVFAGRGRVPGLRVMGTPSLLFLLPGVEFLGG